MSFVLDYLNSSHHYLKIIAPLEYPLFKMGTEESSFFLNGFYFNFNLSTNEIINLSSNWQKSVKVSLLSQKVFLSTTKQNQEKINMTQAILCHLLQNQSLKNSEIDWRELDYYFRAHPRIEILNEKELLYIQKCWEQFAQLMPLIVNQLHSSSLLMRLLAIFHDSPKIKTISNGLSEIAHYNWQIHDNDVEKKHIELLWTYISEGENDISELIKLKLNQIKLELQKFFTDDVLFTLVELKK